MPTRDGWRWFILPALLLAALAFPARAVPLVDGLPLAGPFELVALLLLLLALLLRPPPSGWLHTSWIMTSTALVLKIAVCLAPAPSFLGCYTLLGNSSEGACERSYDQPFGSDATRADRVLDFRSSVDSHGPAVGLSSSNWNISAVNSNKYNFYGPGSQNRDRLPFAVTWRGSLRGGGAGVAAHLDYVGEGSVRVAGVVQDLPPSYSQVSRVSFSVLRDVPILVNYRWAPRGKADGPFGMVRLLDDHERPLSAEPVGGLTRMVSVLAALILLGAFLALAVALVLVLFKRRRAAIAMLSIGAGSAAIVVAGHHSPAVIRAGFVPWILGLCVARLVMTRREAAATAVMSAVVLACGLVYVATGTLDLHHVTYRSAGDDFLTYESLARSMLETRTLQGGESVFVYSPAFRYTLFGQHLLFGDGDAAISVLSVIGLLGGLWFAVERFVFGSLSHEPPGPALRQLWRAEPRRRWLLGLPVVALVAAGSLIAAAEVANGGLMLLSEYPTWILLLIGLPLLLTTNRLPVAAAGAALLALGWIHRADQGFGIAAAIAVGGTHFVVRQSGWFKRLRAMMCLLGPAAAIALLPALHNLAYGHRLVFLPQTPRLPINFPLPPTQLLHLHDPQVRAVLRQQLTGIFGLPSTGTSLPFQVGVHLVQAAMLVALIAAAAGWQRRRVLTYLIVPVMFLAPHVFIQVYVYYPRHIVVGYLAAAITLIGLAATALTRQLPEEPSGGSSRTISAPARAEPDGHPQSV
jgi:hypothetical protein